MAGTRALLTTVIVTFFMCLIFFCGSAQAVSDLPSWWADARNEADRYGYGLLDEKGLTDKLKNDSETLLLDVRAGYEYKDGHIPQALNMEFDLSEEQYISEEKEAAFRDLLGPDLSRPVIIYCRSFR
ncbi:rhodanese-like domain-containing protein [Desulfovibrio sp. JC022]|nr:rhodanese-like domain-containing protein [Desulfovibrio sp. JC022]